MAEYLGYSDSVDFVLHTLGKLRVHGICPTLLCVPDILILRRDPKSEPTRRCQAERLEVPETLYLLDGHACISALTAAYLCLGLASEYNVWLAAKAGPTGKQLLKDIKGDLRRRGCTLFQTFLADGQNREIKTPVDTRERVQRQITQPTPANQLSWQELDSLYCLPWLANSHYGLVVGDAESDLVRNDRDKMQDLICQAVATVIDTSVWKGQDAHACQLWDMAISLVNNTTFVSVSVDDATSLAHVLHFKVDCSLEIVGPALAQTLREGFLVLHGKDINMLISCHDGNIQARVPACDIEPISTNGAGDTFNGALALAATSLLVASPRQARSANLDPATLTHILAFATSVVSLRLKNGRYATRADLLQETRYLRPKELVVPIVVSPSIGPNVEHLVVHDVVDRSQCLAHMLAPVWNDVPKVALIDLDHTLCDSKKWRTIVAIAAFRALDIPGDDTELGSLYDNLYQDHDAWTPIIGGNVRYQWKHEGLFQLALALHTMSVSTASEYQSYRTTFFSSKPLQRRPLHRELLRISNDSQTMHNVKRALEAFEKIPACPYPDTLAALYQLRDVLGFKLMIVTEGDFNTQRWKLERLGLAEMFPEGTVHTEDAFASVQQVDEVFGRAMVRSKNRKTREALQKAKEACTRYRASFKASFRTEALRKAVEEIQKGRGAAFTGVHVCTVGDRIDTDVVPYLNIKRRLESKGGKHSGLVVGRLKRGPYSAQEPTNEDESPDITVHSLPELVARLAEPGFWHVEPMIRNISAQDRPMLTRTEREVLRKVLDLAADVYDVYALIHSILTAAKVQN